MTQVKLARQTNTCTGGLQYYTCTKGPFTGCCSVDPCDTGVCPDDNEQSATTRTTTLRPTTNFQATTIIIVSSAPTDSTITASPKSSVPANITGVTTVVVTASAPNQTKPPSSSPVHGNNNGVVIGSVTGSVVGATILALLLLCCCRRKKLGQQFTLCAWRRARDEEVMVDAQPGGTSPENGFIAPRGGGDPFAEFGGYHKSVRYSHNNATKPEDRKEVPQGLDSPGLTETGSHSLRTSGLSGQKLQEEDLPLSRAELPGTVPQMADLIPELPDDPSPHVPAELSTTPERLLINIPAQRRVNYNRLDGEDASRNDEPLSVTTSDGVVLQANMNSFFNEDTSVRNSTHQGHVLSFMHYNMDSETSSLAGQSRQSREIANKSPTTSQIGISSPTLETEQAGRNDTVSSDSHVGETSPAIPQICISPPLPAPEEESGMLKTKAQESEQDINGTGTVG